jgi:NAD(P)-dependent dehydrogenase (short-subunit alcohol dehydrogenase family)
MAKYGMSMCVLGMAEEFRADGIAVNALWPKTGWYIGSLIKISSFLVDFYFSLIFSVGITTAAMDMLGKLMGDEENRNKLRFPSIMADAAYVILTRDSKNYTRNFAIDEDVLKEVGVTNFDVYAVKPGIYY